MASNDDLAPLTFLELNEHYEDGPKYVDTGAAMSPIALARIRKEITENKRDPKPDIFIVPDEGDIRKQHALIIGPAETPYEGGFFYFTVIYPSDYPSRPPRVKLMTTGDSHVEFNPNLYSCGKSLMNKEPYYNEPGYEGFKNTGTMLSEVKSYNDRVTYETLRVAVVAMLNNEFSDSVGLPAELRNKMEKIFATDYDKYLKLATSNQHLHGKSIYDEWYGSGSNVYDYKAVLQRLEALRERYPTDYEPPDNSDCSKNLEMEEELPNQLNSTAVNTYHQNEDFIDMLYDENDDDDEGDDDGDDDDDDNAEAIEVDNNH